MLSIHKSTVVNTRREFLVDSFGHLEDIPSNIEEYEAEDYEEEAEDEYKDTKNNQQSLTTTSTTTTQSTLEENGGLGGTNSPPNVSIPEDSDDFYLRFVKKLKNVTRDSGQNVNLQCEALGFPEPRKIHWFRNSIEVKSKGRVRIRRITRRHEVGHIGSQLRISKLEVLDKGFYTCEVTNKAKRISSTGILDVLHDPTLERGVIPNYPSAFESFTQIGEPGNIHSINSFHHGPLMSITGSSMESNAINNSKEKLQPPKDGKGICLKYTGKVCKDFIGKRLIYVHSKDASLIIESKLEAALAVVQSSRAGDISEGCSRFAVPSLCYSVFPLCPDSVEEEEEHVNFVSPRRLCREECELLEHDLCRQEYAIAKRHHLIGQQLPLPDCVELPPLGSDTARTCLSLSLPQLSEHIKEDEGCFTGDGSTYRGTVRETKGGEPCRPWSHQLSFKSSDYSELLGGHNYCRNPGGSGAAPWCFSDAQHFRKEECNVPKCSLFGLDNSVVMMGAGGLCLSLIFLLLLLCVCCCRKRGSEKRKRLSGSLVNEVEMSSLLRTKPGLIQVPDIPFGAIAFFQELGEGAFGKVYKGEAVLKYGERPERVAIKTLKGSALAKTRREFLREAELMSELKHPHIVCLLGVCLKSEVSCLLFEYMVHGDLHEFLLSHSPRANGSNEADGAIGPNELLFISKQVASGMEYLSSCHFVHRDLAARNCLVGEGLVVKISDFGLSRDIYSSDYYRVQSKSLLPVRWMPPESILYGKFSTESDVWAYGVLLWEIYSFGLQPYYGYSNQEVIEMIRSRQLLPCPDLCPTRIYALMVECWAERSDRRPSFDELRRRLEEWSGPLLPSSLLLPGGSLGCRSTNSANSVQSTSIQSTGPPSGTTASTHMSTTPGQYNKNRAGSPGLAYQSTPIVHCPANCGSHLNGGGHTAGRGSPHFGGFGPSQTTTPHHHYSQPHVNYGGNGIGNNGKQSPYRVLMESKATNI